MPRRPRQHQIEELSRRALRARLPEAWVVRDLNPDYGLDVAVDIFEDERATGLSFALQLKATENEDLQRALSGIRFTTEMAAFYRAHEVPILVALFHVPTDRLFAKWFHAFDPHYSTSDTRRSRPPRTFSFRLVENEEWVDDTPTKLVAEVRAFRRFRSPELELPVRFHLVLAEEEVHGATLVEHAFALRQAASGIADLVAIRTEAPAAGEPTITLAADKTVIDLAGVASTTVHHEGELDDGDRHATVHNALLALALALEQIGQVNLAAQVASEVAAGSPLIADPEVAFRVAGFMFRSRRISEALRLADVLDQSEDEETRTSSFVLLSPTLAGGDALSDEERRETESVLRRRVERRERVGNLRDAASDYYNLGNHFKTARRGREAFKNYRRAARLRPDYLDRDYFNGEIAGVLFELGYHQLAAHYYRRAIELGATGMAYALYADALLWSGRFREAEEALARYLAGETNGHAEWRLKRLLLSRLRETLGDTQRRRPEAAERLAELRDEDTPETVRMRLEQALVYDGLCGEAWFLLGILAAADPDKAFPLALAGALLHRHSPPAWRNAIVLCWMSDAHRSQLREVVQAGYFLNGQALLEEVIDYTRGRGEGFDRREFLRTVEEAVRSVEDEQPGFEVRILGEGSEYASLRFIPPESGRQD